MMTTPETEKETTLPPTTNKEESLSIEYQAYEHFWNFLDESIRAALRYAGFQGVLRAIHAIAVETFGDRGRKNREARRLRGVRIRGNVTCSTPTDRC